MESSSLRKGGDFKACGVGEDDGACGRVVCVALGLVQSEVVELVVVGFAGGVGGWSSGEGDACVVGG